MKKIKDQALWNATDVLQYALVKCKARVCDFVSRLVAYKFVTRTQEVA